MKKILLSNALNYYRANLHAHSTISDGKKTAAEMKEFYKSHGYSAIAFTDHETFVTHNDLTDDSFVALNGYELGVTESGWNSFTKCCHVCFIALEPENDKDFCFEYTKDPDGKLTLDKSKPTFKREYTGESISEMIKLGRENGFFATYNHPTWSLESYPEYMSYNGMNAMEIQNYGCVAVGYDDDNGHAYDDMLRGGKRIFCVATDDNHNHTPDDSMDCDSFGGYVMINAPKLEYRTLTSALESGNFYASTGTAFHVGPEIHSLVYEDGVVTITTSQVRNIMCMTGSRACKIAQANSGETITSASFKINDNEIYFRLVVTDSEGYKAYTNAYFVDELN
ncbi:MAG: PHP domain-containing protein [Clostridiales bacterium]|nr:PHP domain-containing protein [Clostridiales bacterium]